MRALILSALLCGQLLCAHGPSPDFIEHLIYVGAQDGVPLIGPGVIFRLYLDGKVFRKSESGYELHMLTRRRVMKVEKMVSQLLGEGTLISTECGQGAEIYLIEKGKPAFYSYHGEISCVRLRRNGQDVLFISPFHPSKGGLAKIINPVTKMLDSRSIIEKSVPFKDESLIYPAALCVYLEFLNP